MSESRYLDSSTVISATRLTCRVPDMHILRTDNSLGRINFWEDILVDIFIVKIFSYSTLCVEVPFGNTVFGS